MSPNIFDYATSELSQDAVICWLAAWSAPACSELDEKMHQVGRRFIHAMLEKHDLSSDLPVESVEITKQDQNIDVLIVLDEKMALVVEDKIHSANHSGQLARYVEEIKGRDYKHVAPIYFKIGDQSGYGDIESKGYQPFIRSDILEVLEYGSELGAENDILKSYHRHLTEMERRVRSYETLKVEDKWSRSAWKGFFQLLQTELGGGGWNYVANPSGGFMGFWWHVSRGDAVKVYLQLEEDKLVFKISVADKEAQKRLRKTWHSRIVEAAGPSDLRVVKPLQFGLGRTMTVAVLEGGYRRAGEDGRLDVGATVDTLREAERILDVAIRNAESRAAGSGN